jgi:hypothetical protein
VSDFIGVNAIPLNSGSSATMVQTVTHAPL